MKWLFVFCLVLAVMGLVRAALPIPVINVDSGAHSGTMQVNCDGNQVLSVDVFLDGKYAITYYLPPMAPAQFSIR